MARTPRTSSLRAIGERAFAEGRNIAEAIREYSGTDRNTPEAIEVSYDLQAGEYVRWAEQNGEHVRRYAEQLAGLIDPHLEPGDTLLDAGAGELTTLSHLIPALKTPLARVIACDISQPRLEIGRRYAEQYMGPVELETIKAELSALPLPDSSADVITTNHALEPNGGRERELLTELLRVARRKLVLFEPCHEIASPEARARMESHGYIRGLAASAEAIGATVESVTPLTLVDNPLNPTACFVIRR